MSSYDLIWILVQMLLADEHKNSDEKKNGANG